MSAPSSALIQRGALALMFGLLFLLAHAAQVLIDPWVNYRPDIALLYLPAGVKLLAFVVGGVWGALGIGLAGLITAPWILGGIDASPVYVLSRHLLWVLVPFLTFLAIKRWRGLDHALTGMTHTDLLLVGMGSTTACVAACLGFDAWYMERSLAAFNAAAAGWFLGDVLGIAVVLLATRSLMHWWLRRAAQVG